MKPNGFNRILFGPRGLNRDPSDLANLAKPVCDQRLYTGTKCQKGEHTARLHVCRSGRSTGLQIPKIQKNREYRKLHQNYIQIDFRCHFQNKGIKIWIFTKYDHFQLSSKMLNIRVWSVRTCSGLIGFWLCYGPKAALDCFR